MKIQNLFLSSFVLASALHGGECCPPGTTQFPNGPCEEMTQYCSLPSARHCIENACSLNEWRFNVDASILAWQAREDGLEFALSNVPIPAPAGYLTTNINGHLLTPDFSWNPACKVNLAVALPRRAWDIDVRWTYYYGKTKTVKSGNGYFPLWVLPSSYVATPDVFTKARSTWQVQFNAIDVELGYDPLLTPWLSMRLYGGLKLLSIYQNYVVRYSQGTYDGFTQPYPSRASMRNHARGIGPRIGVDSKWRVSKEWSLLAGFAGSLPLYKFQMRRADYDLSVNSAINAEQSLFTETVHLFRPGLESQVGLSWDHCYGCRKQYLFGFDAAYEVQYFWEQNMLRLLAANQITYSPFAERGDLTFHGFTGTFRFGF